MSRPCCVLVTRDRWVSGIIREDAEEDGAGCFLVSFVGDLPEPIPVHASRLYLRVAGLPRRAAASLWVDAAWSKRRERMRLESAQAWMACSPEESGVVGLPRPGAARWVDGGPEQPLSDLQRSLARPLDG